MKIQILRAAAVSAALALALTLPLQASAQQAPPVTEMQMPEGSVPGELIVQFKPGTSPETQAQVLAAVDGVTVSALADPDTVVARVPLGTEIVALESLIVDTNVVSAEPNMLIQANAQ